MTGNFPDPATHRLLSPPANPRMRTVGEFNRGHMDGFNNIPVDELRERINEIEKGKPVYLICQSGLRSYIASRILEGNGYETYNFSGGFRFYDAVVNDRALIERAYACGMDYKK